MLSKTCYNLVQVKILCQTMLGQSIIFHTIAQHVAPQLVKYRSDLNPRRELPYEKVADNRRLAQRYKLRIPVSLGVLMMKGHNFQLPKYLLMCTRKNNIDSTETYVCSFLGLIFAGLSNPVYHRRLLSGTVAVNRAYSISSVFWGPNLRQSPLGA